MWSVRLELAENIDPQKVQITDISKSYNCRLARMLRKRLSAKGIKKGITVVFSPEEIPENAVRLEEGQKQKIDSGYHFIHASGFRMFYQQCCYSSNYSK